MSSPLETDPSTISELTQLRHQILELQQALVHAKQDHHSTQTTALEAAQVGTWEWDSRTNRMIWSEETERIFGLTPGTFDDSYEGFLALVHPDDRHYLSAAITKAATDHSPYRIEHRILTSSGATRWVACRGRATCSEKEPTSGVVGTVEDITVRKKVELAQRATRETLETLVRERTAGLEQAVHELKTEIARRQQAESALKTSEQRYQLLYEQNPFIYFTLLPDGTVVSVNQFGADQLGYRVEDLIGQSILKVFGSTEHRIVLRQLAACSANLYTVFQWEIQKTRRDGTRLWVKEHARAVHDHTNQILVLVTCEDITERKRTEKQLHETSRLLTTLVEESALPIVSLDREARVVSWNHAATRLFGWSAEEVLGRELPYVQPEEEGHADALWQAGTRRELTGPIELRRQHKDGTMLNLLLWPVFVYDEFDQLSLAVGLYVDQSELKRAEEATLRGETRLRSFLNALDDLAFEFDQDGRYLNVWTHSDDKLLVPKQELIGRRLPDLFGEEAGSHYLEAIRQVFTTGKPATINYAVQLHRVMRYFSGVLTLIPGSQTCPATVGCLVRDITESRLIEAQVRESETRWRALYEHAGVGIAQLNLDGRFLRVNPHFCELLGYSSEAMLQRRFQDLTHPDDLKTNLVYLDELLKDKRHSFSMEKRYRKSNDTWMWVDLTVSLVHRGSSDEAYLIAIVQNIDDRKQAEQALQEQEALLRSVIDTAPDIIFMKDLDGHYRFVNSAFAQTLGTLPEDIIGKTDAELFPPEVADRWIAGDRDVFSGAIEREFEEIVPIKDTPRIFHLIKTPHRDQNGSVIGLVGVARDMTDLKQAERTRRLTQLAIDRSADFVFWVDRSARFLYVNDAACKRLGYSHDELLRMSVSDIDTEYQAERWPEHWAELSRAGRLRFESRHRTKSGETYPVEIVANFIAIEGEEYDFAFVRDISDRKRSYSLLQAAINSVADGLLVIDRQGKVTSTNQRFLHLWNIPQTLADEGDDEALLNFVVDQTEEPEEFLRKVHELCAHPARESFDVVLFKDGRVFERYSRPQVLDNKIVGRVWSFRDTTEHKRAERALRESELRLQRFVAEAPVGLGILDENWRVISANRALCELTGYDEHEMVGSTYALYTHPEDLPANIALMDEFFQGVRSSYSFEKRYIRKSGDIIWVLVKATRIELSGHQGPLLLAAVQDITERKLALEEREQLSRDLHDNLLQALYAVGLQLEAGKLAMGRSLRRSKTHLSQAIRQLNGLMVDVRRFIALLSERTPVQMDFGQSLRELIDSTADADCIAAELDITSPVLSFITPQIGGQLLNIVREALSNSLRHARASRRWVHLSLAHNSIRLLIGDNGIGFSPARKRRAGRGLANMAARAQHMTASYTLESVPGRGTTITVDVPLKKDALYE
ncbi:MAG TPA: PAS domain S-box protein [Nitrospira sp.]|nr:PAS domain S-box protein [Nitrospira sp.]